MSLLYGAAYYLEYMPYDRLKEDIQMMKKAGMNVVRIAESTWSTLEPKEGVFDFSYIDRVLDAAEDMYVIIGTPTYAIPSWLAKKDEDILITTKNGRAKYGPRQIINVMHPVFREHAEIVIRKLVEHTANRKNVIGFQIDNETKHHGNLGKEVQELFKEYLKEKYKTTDVLNKTFGLAYWSNAIADWDDLPDLTASINGGLVSELDAFKRKLAADYLQWQSDIVREYKREDQFITHNMDFEWRKFGADIAPDGYSYGVQPDINHYQVSQALTVAGTDIYHPTQDDLTGKEIAFGGDSIRSLKYDNYYVLECQAQAFKYWTPYPGQLRLQAYSHLASGASAVMYWNWHSIHNSFETYWKGVLSHDLKENAVYKEACTIGAEWGKYSDRITLKEKKNEIAVVVDNRCLDALKWFPADKDLSYNDIVRWMYDSLYEMNMECDIVDVQALDTSKYRMIVTPGLYSASEKTIQDLKEFVKRGGVLVSSFRSFVANEQLSVYHDYLPYQLNDCFGMYYQQFTEPGKIRVAGKPVTCFAELLMAKEAETLAAYEHRYWGDYSAITRNSYGNGKAYYVGCYTDKDTLKEIFDAAISDAKITNIGKEQNLVWPVTVRNGKNALGKNVHYLLHYSEDEKEIFCPYEKAEDVLTGEVYEKGSKILLKDWDVKILEER